MMRTSLHHAILWLLVGGLTQTSCAQPQKPNVILIISDDLGYADLGCQGSKDVKTPHIDSLTRNGIRFTKGYVTSPQCGPSRSGLLTGRYQARFGFESNFYARKPAIPVSEKLISDRMRAAAYVTGYLGKWGVGNQMVFMESRAPSAASAEAKAVKSSVLQGLRRTGTQDAAPPQRNHCTFQPLVWQAGKPFCGNLTPIS